MKGPHYVCEVSPASTTWFPKGISLRVNLFQFILEIDWLLMFPCLFIFLFFTLWFSQINSPACVCKKIHIFLRGFLFTFTKTNWFILCAIYQYLFRMDSNDKDFTKNFFEYTFLRFQLFCLQHPTTIFT